MLQLSKADGQKIIDAFNKYTDMHGLDTDHPLYQACGVVEDAFMVCEELGLEPTIILSDELVEELSRIHLEPYRG